MAPLTDSEFLAFSDAFPEHMTEYTADGVALIIPPSDIGTSIRVTEAAFCLGKWNDLAGAAIGLVTGADASFHFADESRRSPDAAWFDAKRWNQAQRPARFFRYSHPSS
jgi:Uma2 family endonuclease